MNLDPGFDSDLGDETSADATTSVQVSGRLVSLAFIRSVLRRSRRLWLALAALGLLIGLGYHLVVPLQYSATATLYLAHPSGGDDTVESANDVAMVDTAAVGQGAIQILGEHDLTPAKLLGKVPAVSVSGNVLNITISGPTPQEAVRRANAVASAYLTFRAEQYGAQNDAVVNAANAQIAKLQQQINQLTDEINAAGANTQNQATSNLIDQRSNLSTQVSSLQGSIQEDQLANLSVAKGSRVITAATALKTSKAKVLLLDGLTGLGAGLGVGLILVVLWGVLSDRLRRREDVAAVLGVPVDVSVGRLGRRRLSPPSVHSLVQRNPAGLRVLAKYLGQELRQNGRTGTVMVVAADDPRVPAAAAGRLGAELAADGKDVVLVDLTAGQVLGMAVSRRRAGAHQVTLAGQEVTLVLPPPAWELEDDGGRGASAAVLERADAVIVLATVDAAYGAWQLQHWAPEAIVAVTAGLCRLDHLRATSELLEAADVWLSSAVLMGADADDQTVGLPAPGGAALGRRIHPARPTGVMAT